ncbi:hypothetical protein ACQW02_03480 [Humitalea sp. 24SJ18S-53]|uniref:hypothetical protein n=1 Tax=Humitalea sp. 24SJ18S-53 TaxID=3422307 RepID=UPI003D678601
MSLRRGFFGLLLGTAVMGAAIGSAQAQCDTSFTLLNESGSTVNEFYFGSSNQQSWGVDQLGTNVLANGRTMNFRARSAGRNDFKVVWANGQTAEIMRIDICSTSQIVATRRGIEAR